MKQLDRTVPLWEVAHRDSRPDETVVEISPYLVIRVLPDKSIMAYRNNGVDVGTFTLSREYIVALEEATR
jgi:hypothetical protein